MLMKLARLDLLLGVDLLCGKPDQESAVGGNEMRLRMAGAVKIFILYSLEYRVLAECPYRLSRQHHAL